jgi:hypothetical protein
MIYYIALAKVAPSLAHKVFNISFVELSAHLYRHAFRPAFTLFTTCLSVGEKNRQLYDS